jgi:hypothetical protein
MYSDDIRPVNLNVLHTLCLITLCVAGKNLILLSSTVLDVTVG